LPTIYLEVRHCDDWRTVGSFGPSDADTVKHGVLIMTRRLRESLSWRLISVRDDAPMRVVATFHPGRMEWEDVT
jgi:hypothetical protein